MAALQRQDSNISSMAAISEDEVLIMWQDVPIAFIPTVPKMKFYGEELQISTQPLMSQKQYEEKMVARRYVLCLLTLAWIASCAVSSTMTTD